MLKNDKTIKRGFFVCIELAATLFNDGSFGYKEAEANVPIDGKKYGVEFRLIEQGTQGQYLMPPKSRCPPLTVSIQSPYYNEGFDEGDEPAQPMT